MHQSKIYRVVHGKWKRKKKRKRRGIIADKALHISYYWLLKKKEKRMVMQRQRGRWRKNTVTMIKNGIILLTWRAAALPEGTSGSCCSCWSLCGLAVLSYQTSAQGGGSSNSTQQTMSVLIRGSQSELEARCPQQIKLKSRPLIIMTQTLQQLLKRQRDRERERERWSRKTNTDSNN